MATHEQSQYPGASERKSFSMSLPNGLYEQIVEYKRAGDHPNMAQAVLELATLALSGNPDAAAIARARERARVEFLRWFFSRHREFTLQMLAEFDQLKG
jgi:hypothetical protein